MIGAALDLPIVTVESTSPNTKLDEEALQGLQGGMLLGDQTIQTMRRTLLLSLTIVLLQTIYNGYLFGITFRQLAGTCLIAVMLSVYLLLGLKKLRMALRVMVTGLSSIIFALCWVVAGVRTPALFFISGICTFAALQISLRAAKLVFICAVINVFALVLAEHFGFQFPNAPSTSLGIALMITFSTLGALLTSIAAYRTFRRQLTRVMEMSHAQSQQMQDLKHSEERFSALFKANPLPSTTNDSDGRMLDVNLAWERLFGMNTAEVLGKTAIELGIVVNHSEYANVLRVLQSKGRVDGMPLTLTTADQEQLLYLIYVAPVEFGGAHRFVLTLLDQSDRLAKEQAQEAAKEELERLVDQRTAELQQTVENLTSTQEELMRAEKLASLGALVAGISHELNTPIGISVTAASTFQSQASNVREKVAAGTFRRTDMEDFMQLVDETSTLILRSSQRAAELISSFKQVAVDRESQRQREFDLRELIDDIVISLKHSFNQKNVVVKIQLESAIVCNSWPGALGQILTNLLQNACVHAFDGRDRGIINVRGWLDGDSVEVQVQDNGNGMTEHNLKHAFDPFFTTRLGKGGSGLGLSVSYNLARTMLGGSLSATSQLGEGSCMTLRFLHNPVSPDVSNDMTADNLAQ